MTSAGWHRSPVGREKHLVERLTCISPAQLNRAVVHRDSDQLADRQQHETSHGAAAPTGGATCAATCHCTAAAARRTAHLAADAQEWQRVMVLVLALALRSCLLLQHLLLRQESNVGARVQQQRAFRGRNGHWGGRRRPAARTQQQREARRGCGRKAGGIIGSGCGSPGRPHSCHLCKAAGLPHPDAPVSATTAKPATRQRRERGDLARVRLPQRQHRAAEPLQEHTCAAAASHGDPPADAAVTGGRLAITQRSHVHHLVVAIHGATPAAAAAAAEQRRQAAAAAAGRCCAQRGRGGPPGQHPLTQHDAARRVQVQHARVAGAGPQKRRAAAAAARLCVEGEARVADARRPRGAVDGGNVRRRRRRRGAQRQRWCWHCGCRTALCRSLRGRRCRRRQRHGAAAAACSGGCVSSGVRGNTLCVRAAAPRPRRSLQLREPRTGGQPPEVVPAAH
eukprot:227843-Chlamydomonas_euryale.AAC.1